MTDEEVDELLKGVPVDAYVLSCFYKSPHLIPPTRSGNINYESFVRTILSQ